MNLTAIVLLILGEVRALSPIVLAVLSGLGMILTKSLGWGVSEIFQALSIVFSGVSAFIIKKSMAELSAVTSALSAPTGGKGEAPVTGS